MTQSNSLIKIWNTKYEDITNHVLTPAKDIHGSEILPF